MSRRAPWWALLGVGCIPQIEATQEPFDLPPSLGFLVRWTPTESNLLAFEPDLSPPPNLNGIAEGAVELLTYEGLRLADLGLTPGEQPPVFQGRRALPPPKERWRLDLETGQWVPQPADLVGLEQIKLPALALQACVDADRCYETGGDRCPECTEVTLTELDPPTPPEPLRAECSGGWAVEGPSDRSACRPLPLSCANPSVALPGDLACGSLGRSCPGEGRFGTPELGRRPIYVRGGPGPGSGSVADPFGSLDSALAVAQAGDQILLAAGRYPASSIPAQVAVVGSCAEQVTVVSPGLVVGDGARLAEVVVEGGLVIPGTATVAAVRLDASPGFGIYAGVGASLLARRVWIRSPASGGIGATQASLNLRQVRIEGSTSGGILVDRSQLTLLDLAVYGAGGHGLRVEGGRLEARRLEVQDSLQEGLKVIGGALTLTEALIDRAGQTAVVLESVPTSTLAQLWVRSPGGAGLRFVGSRASISDLRIDGAEGAIPSDRHGVKSDGRSWLRFRRLAIHGVVDGVCATDSELEIEDAVIEDLLGPQSLGIRAFQASPLSLARARIGGFAGIGVASFVDMNGPSRQSVTLSDLDVFALSVDPEGKGGTGVSLDGIDAGHLSRVRIRGAAQLGFSVRGRSDTPINLSDLEILDSSVGFERAGGGLTTGDRVRILGYGCTGLVIRADGLSLQNLVVSSGPQGCRGGGVNDEQEALALRPSLAILGSIPDAFHFERFRIIGPGKVGVRAYESPGLISVQDGTIRDVEVGLGVPSEGDTFLLSNVRFEEVNRAQAALVQ